MSKFNVAYFAASCDTPDVNKKFAASLDLNYPILSDPSRKTTNQYGLTDAVRKVPRRWTIYVGLNGKILLIDKNVKAASHGADVVARLKELGVATK